VASTDTSSHLSETFPPCSNDRVAIETIRNYPEMPIQIICPGCHTRFTVADQHGGKTGACPKCKGQIQIPEASEEIVIHAPELEAGAKDSKGRSVLKPIRRKETKFSVNIFVAVAGLVALSIAIAWLLGHNDLGDKLIWVLAAGSILLGPPLAYSGYSFLRDDESGFYQGSSVLVRSLACGLLYALLWGVYVFVGTQWFGDDFSAGLEMVPIACMFIPVTIVGAGAALVCFDLEMITGFFHYALYLAVTVGLRFVMGLPLLPGMSE
jgi:hypothetical protein